MPIYEYITSVPEKACDYCREVFEHLEKINDRRLVVCPKCGRPVRRCISAPSINTTMTNLDDRAKSAGFTKFKRLGKGEYEKQY